MGLRGGGRGGDNDRSVAQLAPHQLKWLDQLMRVCAVAVVRVHALTVAPSGSRGAAVLRDGVLVARSWRIPGFGMW